MNLSLRFTAALIGAALCLSGPAAAGAAAAQEPVVAAPAGTVGGVREGDVDVFRAIPYAAPPVGARRWRPPSPMPRWSGVRPARETGVACMQPGMAPGPYNRGPVRMSEDCLTLDITVPADARRAGSQANRRAPQAVAARSPANRRAPHAGLPVMVWIHGGTLIWGTGHSPSYDGRAFAHRGVVLVSINYRLGVLGYLAHSELSRESADGVSGNYGLLDQIAALCWVRANIAAFGGDPSNVTIFGESAGALSVELLVASPAARGTFDRAIAESPYAFTMPELRAAAHAVPAAEATGADLAARLGASGIAALRAMEPGALVNGAAQAGYAPNPTVDGRILPRQLVDIFDRGEQAPVPLIAGFNSGEIRGLRFLLPPLPPSAEAYAADIRTRYGDLAGAWLRLYPGADAEQTRLASTRDVVFGWAVERLARKQAAIRSPSYIYYFDHDYPAARAADLTAFHAAEVPFVFGTFDATPPGWPAIQDVPRERRISDAMLDYWTSFARTGRPAAAGGPDWPEFAPGRNVMTFAEAPRVTRDFMPGMYELHEQVMCRRRADGTQSWDWRTSSTAPPLPPRAPSCSH